ncbi:unnamed protein product [Somion occarium]|uniref:Cytochrome P450 n=1 Tax=Somion occarium TaxID=3059160 RepID=A0ABP1DFY9_9APHY
MGPFALSIVLAVVLLSLWKLVELIGRPYRSPLRVLPGPPNPSWLLGFFFAEEESDPRKMQEEWVETYGKNVVTLGLFRKSRLTTVDPRALNHVLLHSADYYKPEMARNALGHLLSNGILITEEKSLELRDVWTAQISGNGGSKRLNVTEGLSRMTLDVIGLAGFGYYFNALNENGERNELNLAFRTLFSAQPTWFHILQIFFPIFRVIPTSRTRQVNHARSIMHRIGMRLIKEKKDALISANPPDKRGMTTSEMHDRDLLSLLIRANLASDIPESQRLSDEDVLAQVPTFLVAGHETTSSAVTWCLFDLARTPQVQAKLREEALIMPTETPTMDELNSLPYLDFVIKETLRLHGPVIESARTAQKDDVIPLSEPYTDRSGEVKDYIKIAKGEDIMIPIIMINRWKHIWGEDAEEFKPERWVNPPEAIEGSPGIWSHMLTFLDGPRACIGYRFSLVEMKALLFTLLRTLEFSLAVPVEDIAIQQGIIARPMLAGEPEKGVQMPLIIKLYAPE